MRTTNSHALNNNLLDILVTLGKNIVGEILFLKHYILQKIKLQLHEKKRSVNGTALIILSVAKGNLFILQG